MKISTPEGIEFDGLGLPDYAIKIDHTNKTLEWRDNEQTRNLDITKKARLEQEAEKKYPGYQWMREYIKGDGTIIWATSEEEANDIYKIMI